MAFHTACPITCRKICFCPLGFPKGKHQLLEDVFLGDVAKLEEFIKNPWPKPATIQVKVPKLVVAPSQEAPVGDDGGGSSRDGEEVAAVGDDGGGSGGDGEEVAATSSARTKHAALPKKAASSSMVVVDIAKRFDSGDVEGSMKDVGGEDQGPSNGKVMCRLCFSSENEGGEGARKMMSCKSCRKKCHLSCLKAWGQHRDLFHWSSWTCPSCRLCEGCQETGDPNKFMYCKRCDAAYHCYCMQPPQKNVRSGPYLCPKHTKCHSCCSKVPGNGLSLRWFLGYTCCDACGKLFVKGNYCRVCLKVYRDSEATPMVCCDICQRWVHCQCDGISDEKYLQFQQNENLPYSCPTCRGNDYELINLEDAVQELWRRRDVADRDLIASLRAAAGLPVEDKIFSISPFSDDEDSAPVVKHDHSRSLKFSLKGLVDKSPKKSKEYGKKTTYKKPGKKKVLTGQNEGHLDAPSGGYSAGDVKNEELQGYGEMDSFSSPVGSLTEGICSINQAGVIKDKFIDEVAGNTGKRTVQMKGSKPQHLDGDDVGTQTSIPKTSKGPKLVIHLGSRNKNIAGSPMSDVSSCQKEQDLTISNGGEDQVQLRENENSGRNDTAAKLGGGKGAGAGVPDTRDNKLASVKHAEAGRASSDDLNVEENSTRSVSNSTRKDPKPPLWFKFKNPYHENQNAWASTGQRSKRKRAPAIIGEKSSTRSDDNSSQRYEDNTMDDFLDANWILQKLGQDAKGKRVEFHHPSDKTWHRGTVEEVFEGSSVVCVALDDGKKKNLVLGKQGVRLVLQKQKH